MRSDWTRPSVYSLPGEGEKRIMLRISYDGSAFHGWQAQGNAVSVQSVISEVLSDVGAVRLQTVSLDFNDGTPMPACMRSVRSAISIPFRILPLSCTARY